MSSFSSVCEDTTSIQRMVMREIYLYVLLGHLVIAGVGSVCLPVYCLRCNTTGDTPADSCPLCSNTTAQCIDVPPEFLSKCKKDFQVSVNSTGSKVEEGESVTLTCADNLPDLNLMFWWKKDKVEIAEGQNKSKLFLEKVFSHHSGQYTCHVNSSCGSYESSPHGVTVNNNSVVILVICGVSAVVLVLTLGLVMKFKLSRDNAKHRERMRQQREQAEQAAGPAPFTPRES